MSLVNIPGYFQNKTIKLSDSFIVVLDGKECYRCAGFTIPKIVEFNEEVHKYGNTAQKMLIPKIDILPELMIDVYDGYVRSKDGKSILAVSEASGLFYTHSEGGAGVGKGFDEQSLYDNQGFARKLATYKPTEYDYKTADIYIMNDDMTKSVYKYSFTDLKLTNYTPYELSYQDESLTKWSLSFVFGTMKKGPDNTTISKLEKSK